MRTSAWPTNDLQHHDDPGAQQRSQLGPARQPGAQPGQHHGHERGDQQELGEHPRAGGEDHPGPTGRLSRQRAPRPSRHQALTPNSSAPPEATRPGRIVICGQSRLPASATTPGPIARTARPRRMARPARPSPGRCGPAWRAASGGAGGPGGCRSRPAARRAARAGRRGGPGSRRARPRRREGHLTPIDSTQRILNPSTTQTISASQASREVRPCDGSAEASPRPPPAPGRALGWSRCRAGTADRLHRPRHDLPDRGGGHDPDERLLICGHYHPLDAVRRDAHQEPGLEQPGQCPRGASRRAPEAGQRSG